MSTREKILKEAGRLFYQLGAHAVGTEAICKAAGVTKPTLYHHFGSKDELIAEYMRSSHSIILSKYKQVVEITEGSTVEKLNALVDLIETQTSKPTWNGCAFQRVASDLNGQRDHPAFLAAADHKREWEEWLAGFLRTQNISDSETKAKTIAILLDGTIALATIQNDNTYFDIARKTMENVLVQPEN